MRWVKHMTAAWDDEKIAKLVGVGGAEGMAAYGMWWRIVEIVASQMDSKTTHCAVTYPVTRWSLLLSLRGSLVRHWVEKLAVTGLLTAEWVGSDITVTIPKLLKYRDEYSKKSGHTPAQDTDIEQKQREIQSIDPIIHSVTMGDQETPAKPQAKQIRRSQFKPEPAIPEEWAKYASEKYAWNLVRSVQEYAKFGDYWLGQGRPMANWLATWRTWCGRAHERKPSQQGRFGETEVLYPKTRMTADGYHETLMSSGNWVRG